MEKNLIILANSRRNAGRCIAGKEDIKPHNWIRSISNRETEEISWDDRHYEDNTDVKLLDIVKIKMLEPSPNDHQKENWLIDSGFRWEKVSTYPRNQLDLLLDIPERLWAYCIPSSYGIRDRIQGKRTENFVNSLYLIKSNYTLIVQDETDWRNRTRKRVRCNFMYNNYEHQLIVTDPLIESEYLQRENGVYEMRQQYLCISLASTYYGYAYLLVASII
jgi:hypothetical protein